MQRTCLFGLGLTCATLVASHAFAQTTSRSEPVPNPAEFASRVLAATDAVLVNHLDPPSRQQMILAGLKAVYAAAGETPPQKLAQKVSALASPEQIESLLAEPLPKPSGHYKGVPTEDVFMDGMFLAVPGGGQLVAAKEQRVLEQFAGNVYVGIQVSLSMDDKKRPVFNDVLAGGPAERAGVKPGEVIDKVDGVSTEGLPLRETVDRLRGAEGTDVVVTVRDPKSDKVRDLKMTRGLLPRKTITTIVPHSGAESALEQRLAAPVPIGYVQVNEINGSTLQELRQFARQLEDAGARGVLIDLRGNSRATLHATVLLADALLDSGLIGKVRTARSETVYRAEPDALFQNQPIAVLVDGKTAGPAEWLAAGLQDNRRAVVFGDATAGVADVETSVPILDGAYAVMMMTGRLERADGRPLAKKRRPSDPEITLISRIRRESEPTAKKNEGGVTPDVILGASAAQTPVAPSQSRRTAPVEAPSVRDPVIEEARSWLVKQLAKAGS